MIYCDLQCRFKKIETLDAEFGDSVPVCSAEREAWEAAVASGAGASGGINGGGVPWGCPIWQGLAGPWEEAYERQAA